MENVFASSGLQAPRRVGRSVGAVLAGLVAIVVTHTGTDAICHATGVFPPAGEMMSDALFGLATAYRIFFEVLGAALTAHLAPARPLKHALVLGAIGVVASTAGLLATINHVPALGPLWYPLALIVTSVPASWLGAVLVTSRRAA